MRKFAMILAAAGAAVAMPAYAEVTTDNMEVTLNVANACTLVASGLNFGNQNFIGGTAIDSQASLLVKCTKSAAYDITLGDGLNAATLGARNLKSGTVTVPYQLYSDAGRTTAWSGIAKVSGTGTGVDQTIAVYGRIPASAAAVAAGVYVDTVAVTLTF